MIAWKRRDRLRTVLACGMVLVGAEGLSSGCRAGDCHPATVLCAPTKGQPVIGPAQERPIVIINGRSTSSWPAPSINVSGFESWITLTSDRFTNATSFVSVAYTGHSLYDIRWYHYGPRTVVVRFKCYPPVVAFGSPQVPGGPGGDHVTVVLSTPSTNNGPFPVGDTTLEPPAGP